MTLLPLPGVLPPPDPTLSQFDTLAPARPRDTAPRREEILRRGRRVTLLRGHRQFVTQDRKERFLQKVEKSNECWVWRGSVSRDGYGKFQWCTRVTKRAHRAAYELLVGEIPPGLYLLHSCDNTLCVNPAHLRPGTQKENVQDAIRKGRRQAFPCRKKSTQEPEISTAIEWWG